MKITQTVMFTFIKTISISLVYVLTIIATYAQDYNFKELQARVVNSQNMHFANVEVMNDWVDTQNSDGSWADMHYGKVDFNGSLNNNHVHRLWQLAGACSTASHEKYNNSTYKQALKKGLQFWYNSKTVASNWWFNKIYFPQRLGEILIFMRAFDGFIPQTTVEGIDEPEILSLFEPTAIKDITLYNSGANAVDIALHYVYKGLLTEDAKLLEDTKNKLESILADNIKADMVYHDHGAQIMIASYGPVFCEGLLRLASYLADSPAAFDTKSENFSKILSFIRETQLSSTRGRSWDFSVLGRGISRENAMYAKMGYLQILADYIDTENADKYLNVLSRIKGDNPPNYKVREFNKHYWVSDYTQHARSEYLFTVRNTSTRTNEGETGNGENLKANYLSYGANFMSIDGDEYINIMPVWDWSMIPGTTFPYITKFPKRRTWGFNFGNTTFVGGVTDGHYGTSVLDLDQAGITAKKSWFMFDDEIVCLGAGIVDNSGRNVRTTINQAWMQTPSYVCEVNQAKEQEKGLNLEPYNNTNLKYLRQGKFGYYFPNKTNVKFAMQSKTGSWKAINILEDSTTTKPQDVFSLWIDHGNNPDNATYSYIVVPNIDTQKKAEQYNMNAVHIIENTSAIQAVYHKTLDMLQAVFYQAGTVKLKGLSVTVNRPCALILKQDGTITVSNPSQTYSDVLVSIKDKRNTFSKVIHLPTKNKLEGASASVNYKIEKQ